MQLYYILEQFYEKAQNSPDAGEAQTHINEYFADTENTFFFDKNKIN